MSLKLGDKINLTIHDLAFGGRGTVWGTLAGVLFISLINNVMIFARLSPEWQSIIIGCVLVIAVAMDRFLGARR